MKQTCVIFGAGEIGAPLPPQDDTCFYIAADAGYTSLRKAGVRPDLLIGDFDSLGAALPEDVPVIRLPVKKDVTDTDAAAAEGIRRGCTDFVFYGVLGGRPDHSLANLALLARLSQQGYSAKAYGAGFEIAAVTDGRISFPAGRIGAAAVFSWTDISEGVTIEGFQYTLQNGTLRSNFALGVSNSFTGQEAFAEVKKGTLIVMAELGVEF